MTQYIDKDYTIYGAVGEVVPPFDVSFNYGFLPLSVTTE